MDKYFIHNCSKIVMCLWNCHLFCKHNGSFKENIREQIEFSPGKRDDSSRKCMGESVVHFLIISYTSFIGQFHFSSLFIFSDHSIAWSLVLFHSRSRSRSLSLSPSLPLPLLLALFLSVCRSRALPLAHAWSHSLAPYFSRSACSFLSLVLLLFPSLQIDLACSSSVDFSLRCGFLLCGFLRWATRNTRKKSTAEKSTEKKSTARERECVCRERECVNALENALGHERETHTKNDGIQRFFMSVRME